MTVQFKVDTNRSTGLTLLFQFWNGTDGSHTADLREARCCVSNYCLLDVWVICGVVAAKDLCMSCLFGRAPTTSIMHIRLLQAGCSLFKPLAHTCSALQSTLLHVATCPFTCPSIKDVNHILQHRFRHTTAQVPDTVNAAILPIQTTSRQIGRLNHIAIAVPSLASAAAKYRDVLGAQARVGAHQHLALMSCCNPGI